MRKAVADFEASLARIRTLANNIVSTTGLALADRSILELHEIQQCGAIVLLSGYFEAFLKDLVRAFIENVCLSGLEFRMLPAPLQHRHFEGGGDVLRKVSISDRTGNPSHYGSINREDVVQRLHSVVASKSYEIVWEAFADTQSNPNPGVVSGIAASLGLDKNRFWTEISSRCGGTPKWSATALEASLVSLIAQRNECAHTGKTSPVPSANDILEFADMFSALAIGFVASLEVHLATLRAANSPPAAAAMPATAPAPIAAPGSMPLASPLVEVVGPSEGPPT